VGSATGISISNCDWNWGIASTHIEVPRAGL